jgi:hypothetical protein
MRVVASRFAAGTAAGSSDLAAGNGGVSDADANNDAFGVFVLDGVRLTVR